MRAEWDDEWPTYTTFPILKTCRMCGVEKHIFYGFAGSTSGTKDGRCSVCRECENARRRQVYRKVKSADSSRYTR